MSLKTFLSDEGFRSTGQAKRGRHFLEAHGIIRASDAEIGTDQASHARQLFRRLQFRACPSCMEGREAPADEVFRPVIVDSVHCDLCRGASNRRAAARLSRAMREHDLSRLLIVGGGDDAIADLRNLLGGSGIEVHVVHGLKGGATTKEANEQMGWAQVMVIWKPAQLQHRVSTPFKQGSQWGVIVVDVIRRGVEALCDAVSDRIESRSGPRIP